MPPAVWGPKLWKLLHILGYYSARVPEIMKKDAKREMDWMLSHLETIVPCVECRLHIEEYRRTVAAPGTLNEVAEWMWRFHEAVNVRLGKTGVPFTGDLGQIEKGETLKNLWANYTTEIFQTVQMGQLPGAGIKKFQQHLFLWKGFCGF
jgi:hypothetical protein